MDALSETAADLFATCNYTHVHELTCGRVRFGGACFCAYRNSPVGWF
jgi:hypothetical protein